MRPRAHSIVGRYLRHKVAEAVGFHGWRMDSKDMRMPGPDFSDSKPIPMEDLVEAIDYLEEKKPGLLVAYSRGGAVAMLALKGSSVKPKVIWVAPAWRRGWAKANPSGAKGVILHGDKDKSVPLQHSCQLSEQTGMPLRVVPGRGHVNILKDKTNPNAGVAVPRDKVQECAQTLPDWGTSGQGSPQEIEQQVEFSKSLKEAKMSRIAKILVEEGLLKRAEGLIKYASNLDSLSDAELDAELDVLFDAEEGGRDLTPEENKRMSEIFAEQRKREREKEAKERMAVLKAVRRLTPSKRIFDEVANAEPDVFYTTHALSGLKPRSLKKMLEVLAVSLLIGYEYDYMLIERKLGSVKRKLKQTIGTGDILEAFEKNADALKRAARDIFWK